MAASVEISRNADVLKFMIISHSKAMHQERAAAAAVAAATSTHKKMASTKKKRTNSDNDRISV